MPAIRAAVRVVCDALCALVRGERREFDQNCESKRHGIVPNRLINSTPALRNRSRAARGEFTTLPSCASREPETGEGRSSVSVERLDWTKQFSEAERACGWSDVDGRRPRPRCAMNDGKGEGRPRAHRHTFLFCHFVFLVAGDIHALAAIFIDQALKLDSSRPPPAPSAPLHCEPLIH